MKNMSCMLILMKEYAEAAEMCNAILKNNAGDIVALYRCAVAYIGINRLQVAKEMLSSIVKLAKDSRNENLIILAKQELIKIDIIEHLDDYKMAPIVT